MQRRFYMKDGSGKKRSPTVVVLFLFIFLVVVVLVALYLLGAKSRNSSSQTTVRATPTVMLPTSSGFNHTVSASSSGSITVEPSVALQRESLHIVVLNGSGTVGAASGISTYLSKLGYTVVSVANADAYNYRSITVLVQSSKSSYAQLLKKDLEASYASVSASVSDTISADAEVIIGR